MGGPNDRYEDAAERRREREKPQEIADSSRCSDSVQQKIKLIKAIQEKGQLWDALAVNDALSAARNPDDEEKRQRATNSVSRADYAKRMADEIINLVHSHWPQEK